MSPPVFLTYLVIYISVTLREVVRVVERSNIFFNSFI